MVPNLNRAPKNGGRKVKLSVRLSIPILLVVILQLVTFFAILALVGEFGNIRQYAYSTLEEKTANRRNYVQTQLQGSPTVVQEYSAQINSLVAGILEEKHATIAQVQTDRDLDRDILEASVDTMVELMRRASVNDAYLILESGELYADQGFGDAKAALYLRDLDPRAGSGYDDLMMEVGFTSIAQGFGITRDSGWSLYFTADRSDGKNYDFYYKTLQTARENPTLALSNLGYWSGFSKISVQATASMKYSLPLIADDGTVYGVIGIGLTDNTVLSNIPSYDFLSETACYVLGRAASDNGFEVLTHSGSSFGRLVGTAETLRVGEMLEEGIWDFDMSGDIALAGSVQYIALYDEDSPYAGEQWALISVADRGSVLRPLTRLVQMLLLSTVVSLS